MHGIRGADFREAVEDCGAGFELGYLTIEGARHEVPAKQFDALYLRLGEAAAMIATRLLPDSAGNSFDRTQRFISGNRAGAILFPWLTIGADWNDHIGTACRNPSMALFWCRRHHPH